MFFPKNVFQVLLNELNWYSNGKIPIPIMTDGLVNNLLVNEAIVFVIIFIWYYYVLILHIS